MVQSTDSISKKLSHSISDLSNGLQDDCQNIDLKNSEPTDLSALESIKDIDKKPSYGPRATVPGVVSHTVSVNDEISKGSTYRHRKVIVPRVVSVPTAARSKKESCLSNESTKNMDNQGEEDVTRSNYMPTSIDTAYGGMKTNTKSKTGVVTNSAAGDVGKISLVETLNCEDNRKGSNYRRQKALLAPTVVKRHITTGNKKKIFSSSDILATKVFNDDNQIKATINLDDLTYEAEANTENNNYNESSLQQSYNDEELEEALPTNGTHRHTIDVGIDEISSYERQHADESQIPAVMGLSQDNALRESVNAEALLVATLVDETNDLTTDVIVDAIIVDEKATPWYKDRRNLIVTILMIAAVTVTAVVSTSVISESSSDDDLGIPLALTELYDSTNGPLWANTWDLSSGQSYCTFYGITCNELDQITRIDVSDNNLHGTIPSELGLMSMLTRLDLEGNSISGTIPSELGMISLMIRLDLDFNAITGTIPSELGMLKSLAFLDLGPNSIRGTLPSNLGKLSSLTFLDVGPNSITGSIPSEVGLLSSLTYLDLEVNSITGTIPSMLGMLSSMTELYFDRNSITGTIPTELGMFPSLTNLEFNVNSISGVIPSELGNLISLKWLYLDNNLIEGTLPTELCTMINTTIYYDDNEISCTCVGSIYVKGTPCN